MTAIPQPASRRLAVTTVRHYIGLRFSRLATPVDERYLLPTNVEVSGRERGDYSSLILMLRNQMA